MDDGALLECRSTWCSTLVGSSLAHKYQARVKVNICGKHTSLLRYGNNYKRKNFYSKGHKSVLEKAIAKIFVEPALKNLGCLNGYVSPSN